MNIGDIRWPADSREASAYYLRFALDVVEGLGVDFPSQCPEPKSIARAYAENALPEDEYRASVEPWWTYLESEGLIRATRDQRALIARLAICLLSANDGERERLGEHLSWFIQVVGFLGFDARVVLAKMNEYFDGDTKASS